jgi:hypothetical protein
MERKQYEVVIKLIANDRPCHAGHKIGDEWVYNALYPAALALSVGGTFHWQEDPDVLILSCPDAEVKNVFELRRRPLKPK